ncbi:MAG: Re/Si-specific NAD(P)(+) transhydrogenase subunit alpha [candidate division Zixibacteria bacterium]|nr:Re/Si-specific NAD(P)(+) transhydrogenase subunit alpha [candidate division Zixibacteria bacterium]NIT51623.1 Re/Si-specific NAD(P)(+) transhydrogenase subunit alpha [candidate division Zixibacteria bacterium]NIU07987.1 Re/Si-specific NAD(P)(+) transhydrogenase subunit alpha [Phycisphaerae bacterium]NIW39495.1 Re/Si-specific NAD(P)(+) transhydrogenase subunit alpha [candidate division Zixibacteria bacterium]
MANDSEKTKVGIPKETFPGELRTAIIPESVSHYSKIGFRVLIESGAGEAAGFSDKQYKDKDAEIIDSRDELFKQADIILHVRAYGTNAEEGKKDLGRYRKGQIVIGFSDPLGSPDKVKELADTGATGFSIELLPRITRAQSMDALSSMATIGGYKAVLLGAKSLGKMFPMLMTAAGTIAPAHVFVIGAGVAGLQAIATARRLGGVVKGYDIRPAVKEQVESLGAKFVELDLETGEAETKGGYAREMDEEFYRKQREMMKSILKESDVVISTAAVPGKKAPILITDEMVEGMAPGSVIVDLAAEQGGNCSLTKIGEEISHKGVTIIGPVNLPASIPRHASQMYSRNLLAFVKNLMKDDRIDLDRDDEIIHESMITKEGEVVNQRVSELLGEKSKSEDERSEG